MKHRITTPLTVLLLLIASVAFGLEAKITGPTQAKAGDLVVLSGADSEGDGFRWIAPEGLQTLTCGDAQQIAFASGTPGEYTFTLIAADTTAAIKFARHTVEIVGSLPTPPNPPDDPPKPAPPLPGDYQSVLEASAAGTAAVNDPPTAAAMARAISDTVTVLENLCETGRCPGLAECKRQMVQSIQDVLLQREGVSRSRDWKGLWRVPVNAAIESLELTTPTQYLAAMKAAAKGCQ
jgi:hypothetical protein